LDPQGAPRLVALTPEELAGRRRENQALLSILERFMSRLCAALPGCRFWISVADREGYQLQSLIGRDPKDLLLPGFSRGGVGENWSEAVCGTNGVGTALAMDAPVFLRPADHFFAALRRREWNCSGVPIRDSGGRTVGVLNLAGPAEGLSSFAHGLNIAAAQGIERELALATATTHLEEQNRRLALLNNLERMLAAEAEDDLPSLQIVQRLGELAPGRIVALLRSDPASGELVTEASHPPDPLVVPARWTVAGDDPVAQCFRTGQPVLRTGDGGLQGCDPDGRPPTLLAQPILAGGTTIGLLLVGNAGPLPLAEEERWLYETVACRLGAQAERRRLRHELRAESGLRQAILEQMDVGVVVIDLARGCLTWNQPMKRFFAAFSQIDFEPGKLPQFDQAFRYPVRFAGGDPDHLLRRVVSSGERVTDEAVILCDPPQTFRVTTNPVRGPAGRVECILQTFADITPYQRLEQRKGELVAMISHELRTPLTGLTGYAQLMKECGNQQDETFQHLLQGLLRELGEMSALVERVVEVNRIELGHPLSFQPVSLRSVLQKEVTGLAAKADVRQVRIELEGPDLMVRGDPEALSRVFANLLHNAVKYSPAGEAVTVRLAREGSAAVIEVSDSGPGIPREYHEDIFDRFSRVPVPEAASVPGSGLGLYIVRRLVERHGGEVKVGNRPGRGTTFTVILPEGG
jgi:two-component system phosphate regulon sensor histidine kinase PhoR